MMPLLAAAQAVDLFEGEAAVSGQTEGERRAALPRALLDALVRRSGDRAIGDEAEVQAALPRAGDWLQQFRYRQDTELVNGVPEPRSTLIVRFLPQAVDALLAKTHSGVWPEPRPVPVVWLGIDDGKGPRLLGNAQSGVVAALSRRATARGLRLSFPLLDLEEQRLVDAGRFWQGDFFAARAASSRYSTRVSLIGRLHREGAGWAVEWSLFEGEERLGFLQQSAASANELLALGADLAADHLAVRFRDLQRNAGPAGRYTVMVVGLSSAVDYARAIAYLETLAVVKAVRVMSAGRDRLHLELQLSTGVGGLAALVADDGVLVAEPLVNPKAEPVFALQP